MSIRDSLNENELGRLFARRSAKDGEQRENYLREKKPGSWGEDTAMDRDWGYFWGV
jgi:hypothetical protein